jgi:hypothetical protein
MIIMDTSMLYRGKMWSSKMHDPESWEQKADKYIEADEKIDILLGANEHLNLNLEILLKSNTSFAISLILGTLYLKGRDTLQQVYKIQEEGEFEKGFEEFWKQEEFLNDNEKFMVEELFCKKLFEETTQWNC